MAINKPKAQAKAPEANAEAKSQALHVENKATEQKADAKAPQPKAEAAPQPKVEAKNKTISAEQPKTAVKLAANSSAPAQEKKEVLAKVAPNTSNVTKPEAKPKDAVHAAPPASKQLIQLKEYPQPDIRGPMPANAHPDSTFSSHLHNDWTYL